jgi:hypothetical protein
VAGICERLAGQVGFPAFERFVLRGGEKPFAIRREAAAHDLGVVGTNPLKTPVFLAVPEGYRAALIAGGNALSAPI